MKEQFATYEIAKSLKELCFNEPCFAIYNKGLSEFESANIGQIRLFSSIFKINDTQSNVSYINDKNSDKVAAPLWQQVIDWLRINYKLEIIIFNCGAKYPTVEEDYDAYYYIISGENGLIVDTYEEAREQAILKAIELIKK